MGQTILKGSTRCLHTALRHVSIDRGQSLNTLITEALETWWAKQPERTRYKL